MLCDACLHLFRNVGESPPGTWTGVRPQRFEYAESNDTWTGSHHTEAGSFLSAVSSRGCYICLTIYRDWSPEMRQQAFSIRSFYQIRLLPSSKPSQLATDCYELGFTMELLEGKEPMVEKQVFECKGDFKILPKTEVQPGEPLLLTENTFEGKCQIQIEKWLKECQSEHKLCGEDWRTTPSNPRRLLRIGDNKKVFLESFEPDSDQRCPKYVTLSHCWQAGVTTKLTTDTLGQAEKGWLLADFPKRFQDAMDIAQWMDIKYIWIDALCIIQDSDSDWLAESARMGDIYANSHCNIAATSARTDKGCFSRRHVKMVEPYALPNPRSNDILKTHVIGYDDFWCNSLLDTTLHARGWVLQERLLSPRTIHFGQEQIFWECRCQMACEAYPKGIPPQFCNWRTRAWRQSDQMLNPNNKLFKHSPSRPQHVMRTHSPNNLKVSRLAERDVKTLWPYRIWSKVIERYMECKLSNPQDKLVAISGIAQKLADLTGERYLAGLWGNDLLAQSLLWYVLSRRQADGTPSIRSSLFGQKGYRAPSWSWASMDARIIWNWPAEHDKVLIDIVDTRIQESPGSSMSSILSAEMDIRGCLIEATLAFASIGDDGQPEENGRYALRFRNEASGQFDRNAGAEAQTVIEPVVHLDTSLMPEATSTAVSLLPVCRRLKGLSGHSEIAVAGLIVAKESQSSLEKRYRRIGMFGLDSEEANHLSLAGFDFLHYDEDHGRHTEREIITIV